MVYHDLSTEVVVIDCLLLDDVCWSEGSLHDGKEQWAPVDLSLRALAFEPEKHFLKVLDGFLYLSLAAQVILENLARQIDLESAFVVFVQQISVVLCEYFLLENYINNFTINYRAQPLLHIVCSLSMYCP